MVISVNDAASMVWPSGECKTSVLTANLRLGIASGGGTGGATPSKRLVQRTRRVYHSSFASDTRRLSNWG